MLYAYADAMIGVAAAYFYFLYSSMTDQWWPPERAVATLCILAGVPIAAVLAAKDSYFLANFIVYWLHTDNAANT